jgi:hypothetical protein
VLLLLLLLLVLLVAVLVAVVAVVGLVQAVGWRVSMAPPAAVRWWWIWQQHCA